MTKLKYLNLENNQLTQILEIPNSIVYLNTIDNPIYSYYLSNFPSIEAKKLTLCYDRYY